jgi:aromatic-amino-acid transaminase
MFASLAEPKPDVILALMAAFRADTRSGKLDLGVGIYKDEAGTTPVMRSVKAAEKRLHDTQTTKAYVGPIGDAAFNDAMVRQVFGEGFATERVGCAQSVGGSGALRVLAELLREASPNAAIHVSDPSWPNHVPLLGAAGFNLHRYPYFNSSTGYVDIEGMLNALSQMPSGDIVVLHGCCHNPTGADLSTEHWSRIADVMESRGLFPFVDLAYQGFGDGLEEDAAATRMLATRLPAMAIAASCSKNFGLYRERVGAAMLVGPDAAQAKRALGRLGAVIRANYSMPPDHGANSTRIVLDDETLYADWRVELEAMRLRMLALRQSFADHMRKRSNSDKFDAVATQKGMFSRLPLTSAQIDALREEHAVYIVGDGRINVAGLPDDPAKMAALCEAIAAVSRV